MQENVYLFASINLIDTLIFDIARWFRCQFSSLLPIIVKKHAFKQQLFGIEPFTYSIRTYQVRI